MAEEMSKSVYAGITLDLGVREILLTAVARVMLGVCAAWLIGLSVIRILEYLIGDSSNLVFVCYVVESVDRINLQYDFRCVFVPH